MAKGQATISAIILLVVFLLVFGIFLGKFASDSGANAIEGQNLIGIEAFFYGNMTLWIVLIMILGMIGAAYFGGFWQ